jgi:ABC-type transport system involved in multi-copper enzyme maturation permease subunit
MNSEPETLSGNPEFAPTRASSSDPRPERIRPLKYILLVVILGIWIAATFLSFSHPVLADRLAVWPYIACLLALVFLFLGALFRRRWKETAIILAIGSVVFLPFYRLNVSFSWLRALAFRLHASPIEEYLSRCKLVQFTENGIKQSVGICERLGLSSDEEYEAIVYDSTGQVMLSASQRTPEWTKAMKHFGPSETLATSEGRMVHLYGNFYDIILSIYDGDLTPEIR